MAPKKPIYGYLLLLKFLSVAAADKRVTPAILQFLNVLVSHSSPQYEARVSQSTIASFFGVSRQAIQKRARQAACLGYVEVQHTARPDGAQGASIYTFNVNLAQDGTLPPAKGCGEGNLLSLREAQSHRVARRDLTEDTNTEMSDGLGNGVTNGRRLGAKFGVENSATDTDRTHMPRTSAVIRRTSTKVNSAIEALERALREAGLAVAAASMPEATWWRAVDAEAECPGAGVAFMRDAIEAGVG